MNILLRYISLVLVIGTLVSCDKTNDFNMLCGYFDLLEKDLLNKKLTSDQKFTFINDQVTKNMSSDSAARETWNAVIGYEPGEGRYVLFKEAAEATLNNAWQCDSMQVL